MVHYGHSCLVPIQNTEGINMLYVFVNIDINLSHFEDCLKENFKPEQKIALVSTIQFIRSLQVRLFPSFFAALAVGLKDKIL